MDKVEARKLVARILTVHGYRNSLIEDIHADGRISDKEMKNLNKEVLNQIYTLLYLIETKKLFKSLYFTDTSWWDDWDEPKIIKEWVRLIEKEDASRT